MNPLPFVRNTRLLRKRLSKFNGNYGEVGFYYLYYLPEILVMLPDLKVVVLRRKYTDWLKSFRNHIKNDSNFFKNGGWKRSYPVYGNNIEYSMWRFYHEYYIRVNSMKKLNDRIKVFNTESLNSVSGLNKIYDHLEIPKENRVYKFHHDNVTTY